MGRRVVWYTGIESFAEACCLRLQDNAVSPAGEEHSAIAEFSAQMGKKVFTFS